MNIDLLPFTAFALQSCGQAAHPAGGDGQTLTLQPAPLSDHSPHEPMSGRASTNQAFDCGNLLRAAVVPAESSVLTITF